MSEQEQLMVELIRQALGKIAREASRWPARDRTEVEAIINGAVADASEALEALEQTLAHGNSLGFPSEGSGHE